MICTTTSSITVHPSNAFGSGVAVSGDGAPSGYASLRTAPEEGGRQVYAAPEEGGKQVFAPKNV